MRTVFSPGCFHVFCCNGDAVENGPAGCVCALGGAGLRDWTDLEPCASWTVYSVLSNLRGAPSLPWLAEVILNVSLIVSSRGATGAASCLLRLARSASASYCCGKFLEAAIHFEVCGFCCEDCCWACAREAEGGAMGPGACVGRPSPGMLLEEVPFARVWLPNGSGRVSNPGGPYPRCVSCIDCCCKLGERDSCVSP